MILYSSTFLTVCHILVVFYVLCRRTVARVAGVRRNRLGCRSAHAGLSGNRKLSNTCLLPPRSLTDIGRNEIHAPRCQLGGTLRVIHRPAVDLQPGGMHCLHALTGQRGMENINVHPVIAQAGNQPSPFSPRSGTGRADPAMWHAPSPILIVEGNENDVIQPAESVDQADHGIGLLLRENALQLQHAVLLVLLAYADVIFQICQPQIIPSLSAVGVKQHDLAEAVPRQPLPRRDPLRRCVADSHHD